MSIFPDINTERTGYRKKKKVLCKHMSRATYFPNHIGSGEEILLCGILIGIFLTHTVCRGYWIKFELGHYRYLSKSVTKIFLPSDSKLFPNIEKLHTNISLFDHVY